MMDRPDRELERMFGDDIFGGQPGQGAPQSTRSSPTVSEDGASLAEAWDELADSPVGYLLRALILVVLLSVLYEVLTILLL